MEVGKHFEIPNTTGAGIYAIVNVNDCRMYIGQATNFKERAKEHLKMLQKGTHTNKYLQEDANKDLYFIILQFVDDKDMRNFLECVYMLQAIYKEYDLYNIQGNAGIEKLEKRITREFMCLLHTSDKFNKSFKMQIGRNAHDIRHSKRMKDLYAMSKEVKASTDML